MAKKPTPLAGEATTTNYGWVKPTVGSSVDLWGGYINADLDSIDGVVHAIDTRPVGVTVSDTPPANPLVGQEWFDGVSGQLYVWYDDGNSSQWVIAVNAAASLLPASTTVLGAVKVDGTTIKAAPDGTISTTVVPMGDNRIINGDMRIDQRNNGASGTATGVYTIDRWSYGGSQAGKGTWQRGVAGGTLLGLGFGNYLSFTSSSAYAPLATDTFHFNQKIEADMVTDFAFGTANAQPVTLSFLAVSSLAGTFSGSLCNDTGARSYPFSFSIPAAGAWTKIAVVIPGDTAGSWVLQGNALAMWVRFDLGCGSSNRGPAGAWAAANYTGVTGAVSVVGTNGATFYVTGVKLEMGSVATPFNRQSLAKSLADCQRYYQTHSFTMCGYNSAGQLIYNSFPLPTQMRAGATTNFNGLSYTNASGLAISASPGDQWVADMTITATGSGVLSGTITLNAEL